MAFEELKQRQSVVWGTGPYQNITETIPDIHERVIDRLGARSGAGPGHRLSSRRLDDPRKGDGCDLRDHEAVHAGASRGGRLAVRLG